MTRIFSRLIMNVFFQCLKMLCQCVRKKSRSKYRVGVEYSAACLILRLSKSKSILSDPCLSHLKSESRALGRDQMAARQLFV